MNFDRRIFLLTLLNLIYWAEHDNILDVSWFCTIDLLQFLQLTSFIIRMYHRCELWSIVLDIAIMEDHACHRTRHEVYIRELLQSHFRYSTNGVALTTTLNTEETNSICLA